MHAAFAAKRYYDHTKNQDPHAADPVGKASPEQHGIIKSFYVCKYAGACCGESGDGLEEGIHKTRDLAADNERKTAKDTEHYPRETDYGKAFTRKNTDPARLYSAEQCTCRTNGTRSYQERANRLLLVIDQPYNNREDHQTSLNKHNKSDCMYYYFCFH